MLEHIDDFVAAYLECAIWSGLDWTDEEEGNPRPLDETFSVEDIAPETVETIREQCEAFITANVDDLRGLDPAQCGHDFCLTRNGHGAGFWDRGLGEIGERLTKSAHTFGESDLYVGDDGRLYV